MKEKEMIEPGMITNSETSETSEMKTWKDKLALLISVILSPFLLAPAFLYVLCAKFSSSTGEFLKYFVITVLFSTIVPLLNACIAVKLKLITDIHVADLKQRKEPFIVGLVSMVMGTTVLYLIKAPIEFIHLGIVMTGAGIIFFLISLYWKISMHLAVMTGMITTLAILADVRYGAALLLLPALIWARIHRKRHSFYQGLAGILLAFTGIYIFFKMLGYPR